MTTLDELERLLKAGTPLPWEVSERTNDWRPQVVSTEHGPICTMCFPDEGEPEANAALITAAINALPGLIESARRAEEMRAALQEIADPQPTFAGPPCCGDTFADACELFGDIARAALKGT